MEPSDNATDYQRLKQFAHEAPLEPGVYLMRNGEGEIIYVGKAKVLRNRLSSYFSGEKDVKTRTLLKRARSIETIQVNNEYEALLLENTLIKQHSPRYNINLKDGKTYPVVRITREDFPRIFKTRHIVSDGSEYFGPFPNVQAVDALLSMVEKLFPLRKCRRFKLRKAPCMYYHIGRCAAPCAGKISEADYALQVQRIRALLSGDSESLIAEFTRKMGDAALGLQYERAAALRDAIRAITELSSENSVVDFDPEGRDYIAWASEGLFTSFTVFSMRGGKMTGRELYRSTSAASEEDSLQSFIMGYYNPSRLPPATIYISGGIENPAELNRWFSDELGSQPSLLPGTEKRHEVVLAMAHQNAREDLARRMKERGNGPALAELQKALDLDTRPNLMEGFDIAQLDGKFPVASLISFRDGVPDKKNYRHFRLKTVDGVVDDFEAMREAVTRRYSRQLADGAELPDLVLIDGGIGQVNAARQVLDDLGFDVPVVGLAKRDEELWLPGASAPIRLPRTSEALKVLQHLRDETHRFATGLNQKLRTKALSLEGLESVEGIGPARARNLMEEFGSLEAIATAEAGDISARCSIPPSAAHAVRAAAKEAVKSRTAAAAKLSDRKNLGKRGLASGRRTAPGGSASDSTGIADLAAEALEEYSKD